MPKEVSFRYYQSMYHAFIMTQIWFHISLAFNSKLFKLFNKFIRSSLISKSNYMVEHLQLRKIIFAICTANVSIALEMFSIKLKKFDANDDYIMFVITCNPLYSSIFIPFHNHPTTHTRP